MGKYTNSRQEEPQHDSNHGKCASYGCDLYGVATDERMPERSTPFYCRFHFGNDTPNGEVTHRINKYKPRLNYLHKLKTMSAVDLMAVDKTMIEGLENTGNIQDFLNDISNYSQKLTYYIRNGKTPSEQPEEHAA